MKKQALYILILLLAACSEHVDNYRNIADKDDMRKFIAATEAYIKSNEDGMKFLSNRQYSAGDVRGKFARFHIGGKEIWIQIPVVRYLCDSASTVDSLKAMPIRTYAIAKYAPDGELRGLWFSEESAKPEYFNAHKTAVFFKSLKGRQSYYSPKGHLLSSEMKDGDEREPWKPDEREDSAVDDPDGTDLPDVEVVAPNPPSRGFDFNFNPWGNMPGYGEEGDVGDIGSDAGGGSSGNYGNDKRPDEPVKDCYDKKMQAAKSKVKDVYDKLQNTSPFTIGTEQLYGFQSFKDAVAQRRGVEWTTTLRDLSSHGYGIGITGARTDNNPYKASYSYIDGDRAVVAAIHNHPNHSSISVVDVMNMLQDMDGHPNLHTMMAWDDSLDVYYCATITDAAKAKQFYNEFANSVDYETGGWKFEDGYKGLGKIDWVYLNKKGSYKKLSEFDKQIYELSAILDCYDAGIALVKINVDNDAGGVRSYKYTSYGVAYSGKGKHVILKECDE